MYNCPADFADEEPKKETFAIKFGTPEDAVAFKKEFEAAQKKNADLLKAK